MRRFQLGARYLLASFLLAGAACAAATPPNVLLLLSDDHSAPHLGSYGSANVTTPNLDAFAAQGMRFTRAYTTAPQCAPSRASIFFGRSPVALGVTRFTQPARGGEVAFTDVLREAGYWVGLDGRHHHLDGRRQDEPHIEAALREAGLKYLEDRFDHVRIISTKGAENVAALPARIGEALDKVPSGRPFFLYFGFNQPHRAWPMNYDRTRFDPAKIKLPPDYPDLPEVRADYAAFLASLNELDRAFGVLAKTLDERKLSDNTLVVFMGDNGESLLRGKGTLYERGTHVPLIVRWPGRVRPASKSDVLVSGEDIAPTILEAVGLRVPRAMTGVSILPALQGRPFTGRSYVFAERGWHAGPVTRTDGLDLSRSVTSARYRLIYNLLPDRAYTPVDMPGTAAWSALVQANEKNQLSPLHQRLLFRTPRPVFELYDLETDPFELTNLAGESATRQIETTLRHELARWMIRESDYLPPPTDRVSTESVRDR